MTKYANFVEQVRVMEQSRFSSVGVREYATFRCPHCLCDAVKIPVEQLASKSSKCKAHLTACPSYTPPAPAESDVAAELRRAREQQEAEREESKRRHEELMGELTTAREKLTGVQGQLDDTRQRLTGVQGQLTDVEGQLSDKRQCLTDVREWGKLKEPDNTLVPQLTFRDANLVAAHDAETARLQTENARLRAELEVTRVAAKEKAPAALLKRAAEAEASGVRMKQELAADVEAAQQDKLHWHGEILKIGAERDQMRRERRRMQVALHPDKVPEGAREWATKAYQTVFN